MQASTLNITDPNGTATTVPLTSVHTLVLGSGASGLNAAVQLHKQGIDDIVIITEGLQMGTSINTGSDKQTYYKLSLCGTDADAPRLLADTFYDGGGMDGDMALVEASVSARGFLNLVDAGVPFPRDAYGQFIGYKTDHDPRQRATSIGPYTSREMCRALIREVERLGIPVHEKVNAVQLLVTGEGDARRACGVLALDPDGDPTAYVADNVVLAVGGPGGLYRTSVYPTVHTGAIGLALMAGARSKGLAESQYGMASIGFRWNVSGTYMQVVPRFVSTESDGESDPREFLREYFDCVGDMNSQVFLKGYQWPFDSRKVIGGSSIVDILVYIETVLRGRRVFLDFRENPEDFDVDALSDEAHAYLEKSEALFGTPIERLRKMNPGAIELYRDHDIDITTEPLEIAVCAQHNNGGLAGTHWWESVNIRHLFPVGEVNGSHGVYRPGGSALNAGQVGSLRAAELIANRYRETSLDGDAAEAAAREAVTAVCAWLAKPGPDAATWQSEREEFQTRMTRAGAHIRNPDMLDTAVEEAWQQWRRIDAEGIASPDPESRMEALRNRQLCFAHAVYLEAVRFAVRSGVGSRGSAITLDPDGARVHDRLDDTWRIAAEDETFREQVLETDVTADGTVQNTWRPRRPIPESDLWFETAWARFREGRIYTDDAQETTNG